MVEDTAVGTAGRPALSTAPSGASRRTDGRAHTAHPQALLDLIADGAKTIEVRVGHPEIRKITAGDTLRITCGDDTLTTRVTQVSEYESFQAMLDAEDPAAIGGPDMTCDQLVAAIRGIYPPEKEALGVFALHPAQTGD